MQKEGKKVSITVYFEEKITIDHQTTTFRKANASEMDDSGESLDEQLARKPEPEDSNSTICPCNKQNIN